MKTLKINFLAASLLLATSLINTSCIGDLDVNPVVEDTFENLIKKDSLAAKGIMAKMYASFTLAGNEGPDKSELKGDNAGESPFLRGIFNMEELTTDLAKNKWGDNGLDQLTTTTNWDANNKFFRYTFNRIYFTVAQCNNFINALSSTKNQPSSNVSEVNSYLAETKFLRALAYFYYVNFFGNGPLITEKDLGNTTPKSVSSRKEIFDFVVSELQSIENSVPDVSEYGRANKASVRMLLAKLFLNAEIYSKTNRYNDALIYAKKVIDDKQFSLSDKYLSIFSGDNHTSKEIIFPFICDATVSQSYGNTTYIIIGSIGKETMQMGTFAVTEAWGGHRTTKALYGLFGNLETSKDQRAKLFFTQGHNYEMNDYRKWEDGYPSTKFRNTNFNQTSSISTLFSNADFPVFRLSDAYLMYAECVLRGATGGSSSEALALINTLRSKRNANTISSGEFNLNFILDERARELSYEGHRRTDLIRFGKFTGGSYLWPWKGGLATGKAIDEDYNLFPIPQTALNANKNIKQNPGF